MKFAFRTWLHSRLLQTLLRRALPTALTVAALVELPLASGLHHLTAQEPDRRQPDSDVELSLDEIEQRVFQQAVGRVAPSVVQIETIGGAERVATVNVGNAPTSGVIASPDGYIVASQYSFTRVPSAILVTLSDGTRLPATYIAADHSRRLVLLKIDTEQPLPVPGPVARSELSVGQWSIAVGKVFDSRLANVSIGVISATDRIWGKAIQTDAKISPHNYGGPLIDWQGRVMGILSPLSNRSDDTLAGTDWYDSGIGFAIPWEDVLARLDRWKQGQDIYPGKLGATFQGSNLYTDPPLVENVLPTSPAEQLGLQPGDRLLQVNSSPVTRMAELRHALGGIDAGQTVELKWVRDNQELSGSGTLARDIEPYFFSHLGLVPTFFRDPSSDTAGVEIEAVVPESPAANADLQPGDILTQINSLPVSTIEDALRVISQVRSQDPLQVTVQRNGATLTESIQLAGWSPLTAEQFALLGDQEQGIPDELPQCELVSIKLAEEENDCLAIVPPSELESPRYRLLIWIPQAGKLDREQLEKDWRDFCHRFQTIVFIPDAGDRKAWNRTDVDVLRKSTDQLLRRYDIPGTDVVCGGVQSGGSLAMLFAFSERDLVRGLACFDANPVLSIAGVETRPNERLLIYAANTSSGEKGAVANFYLQLEKNGHPIASRKREAAEANLTAVERSELGEWLTTVSRF